MADEPVTVLSEDGSWDWLASVALGRLAVCIGGQPEILPVNFVVEDRTVLFRTSEGTKLFAAVASDKVAFEADGYNVADGWSVIIKGRAQVLDAAREIEKVDRTQLMPWIATLKPHYVRVIPSEITGRYFRFGPEPDRNSTFA